MQKSWYESKTVWIAIIQAIAGVLAVIYAQDPAVGTVGLGAILKSALDIWNRYYTSTPMA